jgi:glycerophosphoryl diester phosphodiesterase
LIAHRGASGYAPEHTLAAYELALAQGADFVEQDLQMTRDGSLVCLHDADLARTTNVEEVFPDRATTRDTEGRGQPKKGWYTIDFTLAEIKRLDAGSWFNLANPFAAKPSYAGQKVPTLEEAIKIVGDRAGLYIEIKHFGFYKSLGLDMTRKLASLLDRAGFKNKPRRARVLIQSFSKESLLAMREAAPHYARVQLLPAEDGPPADQQKITERLAREIAEYASGAGPGKNMIAGAEDVQTLHAAGLVVHPYTFRGPTTAVSRRPLDEAQAGGLTLRQQIIAEIERYISFGIDGGFTDYPEIWNQALSESKTTKNNL